MKLSNHWRGLSGRRALCHWGTLRRRWELSTSAVEEAATPLIPGSGARRMTTAATPATCAPACTAVVLGRRGAPACSGGGRPGRTASETTSRGWTVFETPSTPGPLPSIRSSTSGRDRAWTLVSSSVVLFRWARERSAASRGLVGECPAAVEDPGDLSGALAIRSGRKRLLA